MYAPHHYNAPVQRQRHFWTRLLAACLLAICTLAQAQPADLSGYWLGEIGSSREKVVMGLELQADANGRYDMKLDLPVAHLQRQPLHGKADFDNTVLVHPALHMTLRQRGADLVGSLLGAGEHVSLRRASRDQLPSSAPESTETTMLPAPQWQTRLGGQIFASPVVTDGVAYIGTTAGTVFAVDIRDGSLRWGSALGHPIYGSALLHDDAIFVASDGGYVHRLERRSGREQWRASIEDGRSSREPPHPQSAAWEWQAPRPLLVAGLLYIGGGDGSVQALDADTGASRWKTRLSGRIQHSVASDGSTLFVVTEPGTLHALDLRNGKPLWQYRMHARPGAAATVHAGRVFTNDRSGVLHAVDAGSGRPLWQTQFWTSWIESEPSFDGDTLYIGSSDLRKVSAIDTANGRVRWRTDVGGWSWGTPLPRGDMLIVGMAAGSPYFLDHGAGIGVINRGDGRLLARYALPPGHGFQWGIAGSIAGNDSTLVAADVEGVLMGFAVNAVTAAHATAIATLPASTPSVPPRPIAAPPSSPRGSQHP